MKRKGFTLIELLAVIVILAIIALIATPTILGVIEKARKGASEQSALGYIDAVEKQVAINQVKNENLINDGTYNVPMTGITVKGESPTKGWLKIEKGMVINYSFVIGKYVITKGSKTVKGDEPAKSDEEVTKTYPVYNNGTIIYFDPVKNEKCDSYIESNSTTGTKTGCMKWYTFNDEGENSSTVNMILDHNTTAKVASWDESKTQITTDTKDWDNSIGTRLIEAGEVAKITGNANWTNTSDWFCFDTNQPDNTNYCSKAQGTSGYAWLFDYTNPCLGYGCNVADESTWGYWTNTSYNTSHDWLVDRRGGLGYLGGDNTNYGIRPVITVSKSILN